MTKPTRAYREAIDDFAENNECWPHESVLANPACQAIAKRFRKTVDQVALDINRHYLDSYRKPEGSVFNLLDDEG
jgi:hypothetical protein